jgi:hypothetical protein
MACILLLTAGCAAHKVTIETRTLKSFTMSANELSWKIESKSAGKVVKTDTYSIDYHSSTMSFNGESRPIDPDEVPPVERVGAIIARYCQLSTIWWDDNSKTDPGTTPRNKPTSSALHAEVR